jgi:hypothetical protein
MNFKIMSILMLLISVKHINSGLITNKTIYEDYANIKCNNDIELNKLCQHCELLSINKTTYIMCCLNIDGVKIYCENYIKFGSK